MSENKINPPGKFADVPIRIRSWVFIIAIVAVGLLDPRLTSLFIAGISLQGMREYYRMFPVDNKKLQIALYLNVLFLLWFSYHTNYRLFLLVTPVYTSLCLLCFPDKKKKSVNYYKQIIQGILINILAIGHLAFIGNIPAFVEEVNRVHVFLLIVILTEMNDIFQYMSGKLLGRTKVFPRISPNKTLEGFIGGMILTSLLANLLGVYLLPAGTPLFYTLCGLGLSILGSCGDLFMSSLKRNAGVKDTGTLIPGHGGLLDRIDSLIFVAPAAYWVICKVVTGINPICW